MKIVGPNSRFAVVTGLPVGGAVRPELIRPQAAATRPTPQMRESQPVTIANSPQAGGDLVTQLAAPPLVRIEAATEIETAKLAVQLKGIDFVTNLVTQAGGTPFQIVPLIDVANTPPFKLLTGHVQRKVNLEEDPFLSSIPIAIVSDHKPSDKVLQETIIRPLEQQSVFVSHYSQATTSEPEPSWITIFDFHKNIADARERTHEMKRTLAEY